MSHSPTSPSQADEAYSSGWRRIIGQIRTGGSWSGRERNCCFLNTGSTEFADVSAAAGIDFLDDARAVMPVDWDWDGDLDLWFTNRTGPRLRFLRNGTQGSNHYLAVRLKGAKCNRDAIGARVELSVGDGTLIKTVRAEDGYLSQSSKWIHFGLADKLAHQGITVNWPGGASEQFTGVEVDGHFELVQGTGRATRSEIPTAGQALVANQLEVAPPDGPARIVLHDRVPLPTLAYRDLAGQVSTVNALSTGGATLINLWATWCVPCLAELKDLSERRDEFQKLRLTVLALSVDGLQDGAPSPEIARAYLDRLPFPHEAGMANPELLDKLEVLQEVLLSPPREPGQLPTSFLLDRWGRLAVIYLGPVNSDQLIADLPMLDDDSSTDIAFPFPGQWYRRPYGTTAVLAQLASKFAEKGDHGESLRYAGLAADMALRDRVSEELKRELGAIFFNAGATSFQQNKPDLARRHYGQALALVPQWAEAHANMGSAYSGLGDAERAHEHYERALDLNPNLPQARYNSGVIHLQQGNLDQAERAFRSLLDLAANSPAAYNALGLTYSRKGDQAAAVECFRRALQLDPNSQDAKRNLESALREQGP